MPGYMAERDTGAVRIGRPESLNAVARRRIKSWIAATGITQVTLADRINKNQAWMSRYLSGDFDADLDTLAAVAGVFGHSIGALLDAAADPQEQNVIDAYRALPIGARDTVYSVLLLMAQKPRTRRR